MKIILAFPCHRRHMGDPSFEVLPIGMLSLAAVLKREGHDVKVIHMLRYGSKDALRLILDDEPDVVGISCLTFNRKEVAALARTIKEVTQERSPFIVVGGPHVTHLGTLFLERFPFIDAVVTGEAEVSFVGFLQAFAKSSHRNGVPGVLLRDGNKITEGKPCLPCSDLDDLPVVSSPNVAVFGVSPVFQFRHMIVSRGCNAKCVFCASPSSWSGNVRRFSVDRVVREVGWARDCFGITHVSFRDDTFTQNAAWALELCHALREEHPWLLWDCQSRVGTLDQELADAMAESGCIQVQLGVESGSDRILRFLNKPFSCDDVHRCVKTLRRAGISISLYLMTGIPGETEDDLRHTEALVRACRPTSCSVSRLAVYPGSRLAQDADQLWWFGADDENRLLRDDDFSRMSESYLRDLGRSMAMIEPYSIGEMSEVVERLDGAVAPRIMLGQLFERLGRLEPAAAIYHEVLSIVPGHPWAELYLGELSFFQGQFVQAHQYFSRVTKTVPKWPYPLNRLGWTLLKQGRSRDGWATIEHAHRLDPHIEYPPPQTGYSVSQQQPSDGSLRRRDKSRRRKRSKR